MRTLVLSIAVAAFCASPAAARDAVDRDDAHRATAAVAPVFAAYHDTRQATEAWGERYEVWPYQGGTLVRYLYGWHDCPGGGCLKWRVYDYLIRADGSVVFDEVFGLPLPDEAPADLRAFDATLQSTPSAEATASPVEESGATTDDHQTSGQPAEGDGGDEHDQAGGGHGPEAEQEPTGIPAALAAILGLYGLAALTIGALHHRRRSGGA